MDSILNRINDDNIMLSEKDTDKNNIKCYLYFAHLNLQLIVKRLINEICYVIVSIIWSDKFWFLQINVHAIILKYCCIFIKTYVMQETENVTKTNNSIVYLNLSTMKHSLYIYITNLNAFEFATYRNSLM